MAKKPGEVNFLQGSQACAEAALAVGCDFFAARPVPPAGGLYKDMSLKMAQSGGVFLHMEDDNAALGACIGASMAGKKAMTATAGGGLSMMSESIAYAVATQMPCVIIDIQHAGPSMGQPTRPAQGDAQKARWCAAGDQEIIALAPNSAQEMYELTLDAFYFSEKYKTPVILLADEALAHTWEEVSFKKNIEPIQKDKKLLGAGLKLSITGFTHDATGAARLIDAEAQEALSKKLSEKILSGLKNIIKVDKQEMDDADIVIISYGSAARSALAAVNAARKEGIKAGLLRLVTLWPMAEEEIKAFAGKKIAVVEMNNGQVAREVERIAKKDISRLSKATGELITPGEILALIKGM